MKVSATALTVGAQVLLFGAGSTLMAATTGNTIEITTGMDIVRPWADVVNANYAYAPQQSYDAATETTHIYLPYGDTDGVYDKLISVGLSNPVPGSVAEAWSGDGSANTFLSFKFHFDKAISTFTFVNSWGYFALQNDNGDTIIGQFLYSTDGTNWTSLYSTTTGVLGEPLVDATVDNLNTQTLYIALSTSNLTHPDDTYGGSRYTKMRMAGDPNWGNNDPNAFFNNQWDLYVTTAVPEPASMGLLGLAGLALLTRKR